MNLGRYIHFQLDDPSRIRLFCAGDILSGKLIFEGDIPLGGGQSNNLSLWFQGEESTTVTKEYYKNDVGGGECSSHGKNLLYCSDDILKDLSDSDLQQKYFIKHNHDGSSTTTTTKPKRGITASGGGGGTIGAITGHYEIPFSFQIPINIPSTLLAMDRPRYKIEGTSCSISYYLKAKLLVTNNSAHGSDDPVSVAKRRFDIVVVAAAPKHNCGSAAVPFIVVEPKTHQLKKFDIFQFKKQISGEITIGARIGADDTHQNLQQQRNQQRLQIKLGVHNQSYVRGQLIKSIFIQIKQSISWTANTGGIFEGDREHEYTKETILVNKLVRYQHNNIKKIILGEKELKEALLKMKNRQEKIHESIRQQLLLNNDNQQKQEVDDDNDSSSSFLSLITTTLPPIPRHSSTLDTTCTTTTTKLIKVFHQIIIRVKLLNGHELDPMIVPIQLFSTKVRNGTNDNVLVGQVHLQQHLPAGQLQHAL